MLMTAADYRESLRRLSPRVFIDGQRIASVADEPLLAPGIAGVGVTYDFAHMPAHAALMTARQGAAGAAVNRMLHIDESTTDLLRKLEAVRLVCQESECAPAAALSRPTDGGGNCSRSNGEDRCWCLGGTCRLSPACPGRGSGAGHRHDRCQGRSAFSSGQAQAKSRCLSPTLYPRSRRADGIVIRGAKAIVTGAPYMHELLVMPCRTHLPEDASCAVCCAVPVDAAGITMIAKPAGRPGEAAAKFSAKYGQSVAVVLFDDVFVPYDRVFLAGECEAGGHLTTTYATHHRHSCVGARAVRRSPDRR